MPTRSPQCSLTSYPKCLQSGPHYSCKAWLRSYQSFSPLLLITVRLSGLGLGSYICYCFSSLPAYTAMGTVQSRRLIKSAEPVPILFCEDFLGFLSDALCFVLRNTSTPLCTAQTRSWQESCTHPLLEQLHNGWSSRLPSQQHREEDPLLLWSGLGSLYLTMCLSPFWH